MSFETQPMYNVIICPYSDNPKRRQTGVSVRNLGHSEF